MLNIFTNIKNKVKSKLSKKTTKKSKFKIGRLASLQFWAVILVILLSVESWYLLYIQKLTTVYNDSMSHLNISRSVIDNMEPGLAQLGGVWLPLNHILPLFLIWNEWAWRSGFASSFVSMLSYMISVWGIYKIVKALTNKTLPSLLGGLVFAINLNMLYLQATPLTEPLYIVLFVLSALCFVKWVIEYNTKYLLLLGLFGFLQVITRYDGWFVVGMEGMLVFFHELIYRKSSLNIIFGKILFFIFPVIFGISLWLVWNILIFNDPLYFAFGPHSARSQQNAMAEGLITKGSIHYSLLAYYYAILENVGKYTTLLGLVGVIIFFIQKNIIKSINSKIVILLFLLSPVIFNVLALFLGFSIINLPELNWNPGNKLSGQWFNVRYGILALPLVAVLLGVFSNYKKIFLVFTLLILIIQSALTYQGGIITIIDGTVGTSAFENHDIADYLKSEVGDSDTVLLSTSYFNPVAFKGDFQLNQVVHEGVSKRWDYALNNPENYVNWIVVSQVDSGDPVYTSLIKNQKNKFLKDYYLSFGGKHADVYKLKIQKTYFLTQNENI